MDTQDLIDVTDDMADALRSAAIWLRGYESTHKAKGTPSSLVKAQVNASRATMLEVLVERYERLHQPELPL